MVPLGLQLSRICCYNEIADELWVHLAKSVSPCTILYRWQRSLEASALHGEKGGHTVKPLSGHIAWGQDSCPFRKRGRPYLRG